MKSMTRKNTAIMFTDVVGYSRMMEDDELGTFQLMLQLRTLMDTVHQKFEGNLKEFIGDGSLSTFACADHAVRAALELREKVPELLGFHLRIGLHYGPVIQQGKNTGGHAINLASRIEDSADEDSVFLSKHLLDQLDRPESFQVVRRGKYRFKNVKQRVELFSIDPKPTHASAVAPSGFVRKWSTYVSGLSLILFLLIGGSNHIAESEDQPKSMVTCDRTSSVLGTWVCESAFWLPSLGTEERQISYNMELKTREVSHMIKFISL